jgi:hypothetical protein
VTATTERRPPIVVRHNESCRRDQFDWETGLAEPTGAITEVGLFDVDRRARPVAAQWRSLATTPPAAISYKP